MAILQINFTSDQKLPVWNKMGEYGCHEEVVILVNGLWKNKIF
jgi:hypothetical protein